ncbi:NADPH:quinone reductase [Coemansia sp. RSA 2320]|nr:NADPH:quinone reductase [Coemansia sp. RSA 2320]
MVSFGNSSGTVPPVNLFDIAQKNLRLMRPRLYGYLVSDEDYHRHVDEVIRLTQDRVIDVKVFKTYELADVAQAHADLEGRRSTGKLLLRIPPPPHDSSV